MDQLKKFPFLFHPAFLGGALLLLVSVGVFVLAPTEEAERPLVRVETTPVLRADMSGEYTFTGILEADAETDLAAKAQGRVTGLYADTGSRVASGQLLAELDASTERASAASLALHIVAAQESRSAVDRLYAERISNEESPVSSGFGQTSDLAALLSNSASLSDQVNDTLGALLAVRKGVFIDPEIRFNEELGVRDSAQKMRAREELRSYQTLNARYQEFFDTRILGKQPDDRTIKEGVDLANETLLAAISVLNQAYTTLLNTVVSTAVSDPELSEWKSRLTGLGAQVETTLNGMHDTSANISVLKKERDATLADAGATLVALSGQQSVANALVSNSIVRAPFSGVIIRKYVERGTMVAPGVPLFAIADDSTLKLRIGVSDTMVQAFRVGLRASVSVDGVDGTAFSASVTKIEPVVDAASRKVVIEVSIPNGNSALRVGSFARVTFALEGADGAVVPTRAVRTRYDTAVAFVVHEGVVERRVVTLGARANGQLEIVDGLREGEMVVVEGNAYLRDGDRVQVVTTASSTPESRSGEESNIPTHE